MRIFERNKKVGVDTLEKPPITEEHAIKQVHEQFDSLYKKGLEKNLRATSGLESKESKETDTGFADAITTLDNARSKRYKIEEEKAKKKGTPLW